MIPIGFYKVSLAELPVAGWGVQQQDRSRSEIPLGGTNGHCAGGDTFSRFPAAGSSSL